MGVKKGMSATVSWKTLAEEGVPDVPGRVVTLDCQHSTTRVFLVDVGEYGITDSEMISLACAKALAETPCMCIRELQRRWETN